MNACHRGRARARARGLPRVRRAAAVVAASALCAAQAFALTTSNAIAATPLCASAAEAGDVQQRLAAPRANYWSVAAALNVSEAAVLSAVAAARGAATSGSAFREVWESMRAWPEAVSIVMKDGHVFEVHGRVTPGEPSAQSRYFNLKGHDGLSGHLRPDLVAGIYAVELPGRTGPEFGVAFASSTGSVSFAVYVPAGDEATPEGRRAWEATKALIARLPALCPGP
jgi:putative heme iron utilization protein